MIQTATIIIDYAFRLLQAVTFVTFTDKLLTARFGKRLSYLLYSVAIILLFASTVLTDFFGSVMLYIQIPVFFVIIWAYSVVCFKNKLFLRFAVPAMAYFLSVVINLTAYILAQGILNVNWFAMLNSNLFYSVSVKLILSLILIFALYVIYKYCNYSIRLSNFYDYAFFVILPIITLGVLILSFIVLTDSQTSYQVMIVLTLFCAVTVFTSVLVMSLTLRAARSNEIKAQNIIMKNEQELYREKITEANKNLEEIAVIRHDMKNKVLCIGELLSTQNYSEAEKMCNDIKYELSTATVLFNTDNIYLNSILNITYKKAREKDIDIKVIVSCNFEGVASSDLVTVIGNICDNAVEYLSGIEQDRKMSVKLYQKGSYYFISVKNNILTSVLEGNPQLKSHKNDKVYHGHGIKNVRHIVRKYKGSVDISEQDNEFIVNIMLEKPRHGALK